MSSEKLWINGSLIALAVVGLATEVLTRMPAATATEAAPLKAVAQVTRPQFEGEWFEIAKVPYFFENDCARDAKVRYTWLPAENAYEDYFECAPAKGAKKVMVGRARPVDATNAKLSATFLNILGWRYWMGTNYWVLDLAPDGRYILVGEPGRKLAWIMARTPSLPVADLKRLATTLRLQGYDPCRLQLVPQTGGVSHSAGLCPAAGETPASQAKP